MPFQQGSGEDPPTGREVRSFAQGYRQLFGQTRLWRASAGRSPAAHRLLDCLPEGTSAPLPLAATLKKRPLFAHRSEIGQTDLP